MGRLELWRTNARWLALLLLPALIAVGEAGRGLTALSLSQRQSLVGAFPLAMGLAAWHARRDRAAAGRRAGRPAPGGADPIGAEPTR